MSLANTSEDLKPADGHVSELESPLLRLEMTVALAETLIVLLCKSLGWRTQLSHIWIPDSQKL